MLWTTLISICLVFGILVLLVWIMKLFGMIFVSRRKAAAAATQSGKPVEQGQLHEEEIAAMSIKRAYSPWNSKIHGLTQMPDKK